MQLFTATFVKNKCKFLTILWQQKLALTIVCNAVAPHRRKWEKGCNFNVW